MSTFLVTSLAFTDSQVSITTPDVNTVSLEASDEALLPRFVEAAHQNVRCSHCLSLPLNALG